MLKLVAAAAPPKVMFWPAALAVRLLLRVTIPVPRSTAVTVVEAGMPTPEAVEPTTSVAAWARETVRVLPPEGAAVGA